MFDVITIGTATQDVYLVSRNFNGKKVLSFALGSKIEVDEVYITTGGGATNAAVTFARQGFRTATVAKIGNDIPGRIIEDELRKEKVVPFLVRDRKERTAYSTLLLTPSGERTILVHHGASDNLKASEIPWPKLKAKWAYLAAGGIDFPLLKRLVNFFWRQGTMIVLNPGKDQLVLGLRKLTPVINKVNVFIVNREEAARLAKLPYQNEKQIFSELDKAVGGVLVVTDGKRGVKVSDGISRWQAGTFKERKVVDRTGAGDAFGSGFVAGLMQKGEKCEKGVCNPENIAYAIRLGSANATSNIEVLGAKSGLLTKKAFRARRWESLRVTHFK